MKPLSEATVLVVEDNADNFYLFKDLLEEACLLFDGRPSGGQLLGLLAAQPSIQPDLILLDIHLPHEDGYVVLDHIRHHAVLERTKIVACTANATPVSLARAQAAGFDGFIGKPIRQADFIAHLQAVLNGTPVWVL